MKPFFLKWQLARMRDAEIATIKVEEKENSRRILEQSRREVIEFLKKLFLSKLSIICLSFFIITFLLLLSCICCIIFLNMLVKNYNQTGAKYIHFECGCIFSMLVFLIILFIPQLERVYKDKYDALVIRERNALERLQQQTEVLTSYCNSILK